MSGEAKAPDPLSEVHRALGTPNPNFEAWVATMDKKLWARFDLSAARLGWEAALRIGDKTSREEQMVVIERDADGKPTVWCDPEIVDLVRALNAGGIRTVASCSGHGHRPGFIALADGRWLILPRDDTDRAHIDAIFPTDINGENNHDRTE